MKPDRQRLDKTQFAQRETFRDVRLLPRDCEKFFHGAVTLDTKGLIAKAGIGLSAAACGAHTATVVRRDRNVQTRAQMRGSSLAGITMVAAISWPGMRGYETSGFLPRNVLKSVPQKPTILVCSSTSPSPGAACAISPIALCPGAFMINAFMAASLPNRLAVPGKSWTI